MVQCTGLGTGHLYYYGERDATHCLYGFVDLHKLFLATVP